MLARTPLLSRSIKVAYKRRILSREIAMLIERRSSVLLFAISFATAAAYADTPTTFEFPGDSDKVFVVQREQLLDVAGEHFKRNELSQAIIALRSSIELQRKYFPNPPEEIPILERIADWQERQENYVGALATYRECLALNIKELGEQNHHAVDTRVAIALLEQVVALDPAAQSQIAEARKLMLDAKSLLEAGKHAAVIEKTSRALELCEPIVGHENWLAANCLDLLGQSQILLGQYKDAEPTIQKALAIRERVFGKQHPQTLSSVLNLATLYSNRHDFALAEPLLKQIIEHRTTIYGTQHRETVRAWGELATLHLNRADYQQAEPIFVNVLKNQRQLYSGGEHFEVARTMERLGAVYFNQRDLQRTEPLLRDAISMYRKLLGDNHPAITPPLDMLGRTLKSHGKYQEAEQVLTESLAVRTLAFGESHHDNSATLDNLADIYDDIGDISRAERCYRKSLTVAQQSVGERNMLTAFAAENLGDFYSDMGDYGRGETFLQQSVDISSELMGPEHRQTMLGLVKLADAKARSKPDEAKQIYLRALELQQKQLGPTHPELGLTHFSLGLFYLRARDLDEAETHFQQSLTIIRKAYGPTDHETLFVQCQLAELAFRRRNFEQAHLLATEVLQECERQSFADRTLYSQALAMTGIAQFGRGNSVDAEQQLRQALEIKRNRLDVMAKAQTERQQLIGSFDSRSVFDLYLAAAQDAQTPLEQVYEQVLLQKGRSMVRYLQNRATREIQASPLADELQQVSTRLANLTLSVPDASEREPWLKELEQLRERREVIETELSNQQRAGQQTKGIASIDVQTLRNLLPVGTALVDIIEYRQTKPYTEDVPESERFTARYAAFIVRSDRPVVRVELQESETIDTAVEKWRRTRGFKSKKSQADPAAVLRELVWQPLEPHLTECGTILVSSDSGLTRMPFAAIPGKTPGSYLIEEFAIGSVSVPQLLPTILKPASPNSDDHTAASLLAVGDIDFDASESPTPQTDGLLAELTERGGGELATFTALKGSGPEVRSIHDRFKQSFQDAKSLLLGQRTATESTFRHEAPHHRWLHIATHGFFSPPSFRSAVAVQDEWRGKRDDYFWGYVSGLALAGANVPSSKSADNGILTAIEVADLDLRNVEVVVLSGCETGLGQTSSGEGTFGTQRAFEMAGVKTFVGSLWNVPDETTRELMERFYENLWDKKLPKLEALRQAQLAILRGDGTTPKAPHYWAAFFLSGDWQ
jgi:CHAT domain-containing protein